MSPAATKPRGFTIIQEGTGMKLCLLISIIFVFGLAIAGQGPKQRPTVDLKPCELPAADEGKKDRVLCGTYEVFENRATRSGRQIALKIVVYPATTSDKAADAVFYIPGGPGSSSTEDAPYVA